MQIRTKLTILFTLITATIVLAFAFVIYYAAKESREKEFYALLKKEAYTKANVFLKGKVDESTLQEIYRNNRKILNEVQVAIYDADLQLVYHDAVDIDVVKETVDMLRAIRSSNDVGFYQGDWQVVGLTYHYDDKKYIVTAAAYDQYGYKKISNLLKTIILVFVISMLALYFAGRLFVRKAFDPLKQMMQQASYISATNLHLRLNSRNNKDELAKLASTFNQVLARLENSFDAQKNFVSNISHELRTPLSAIIAELELSKNKERSVTEYQSVIGNTLQDARKLAKLSNSLLDFAKASYDPAEIAFRPTRVDEILLDARKQVQQSNEAYRIAINFEEDFDDDALISVNGNEYLLQVAFANLMENGCKFSEDKFVSVSISFQYGKLVLTFTDHGIGILPADQADIFTPFYRGTNKNFIDGNGIGLSLTQKIILLHKGVIQVWSTPESAAGSTFTVHLPSLK